LDQAAQAHWRKTAAAAFHQAGVERHRRLFLAEIIDDFEAGGSEGDPAHAAREQGLLHPADDEMREVVAWYYETAITLSPVFAEALYNLATLRRRAGRLSEAFALFMRAAESQVHPRARQHAFLTANALWEAASIENVRGRLHEAEALYRRALQLLGNFGPEHVQFPRLLQRLNKNEEAVDHYERITQYSHRYAPEFVEPDYDSEERLPQNCDGTPLDPALLTQIGNDRIFYWAHIYFRFPEPKAVTDLPQLLKLLRRYQFFRIIGFARLPIRCNTSVSTLDGRS
jgi:tetratricopeptide (TPR) repeat protein